MKPSLLTNGPRPVGSTVANKACPSSAKLSTSLSDPRDREIGEMNQENGRRLLCNLALYPFTQKLGMSLEAFRTLIAQARTEAADPSLKAYFPL